MINYIIIEDEFPAREELKFFIKQNNHFNLLEEFENPIDALKFINTNNHIDVVFLDINMPEINGINLGQIIYNLNSEIKIIFTTAYREYAVEAFEIRAFDYILKPYSEKKIIETLEKLEKEEKKPQDITKINKITVFQDDKIVVISLDEIYYIEVNDKDTHIYTKDNQYISKFKISKWEEILPRKKFYRTHRGYIVNLDIIKEIEPWFNGTYILKLQDVDFRIPVSRNNTKEFKDLFFLK